MGLFCIMDRYILNLHQLEISDLWSACELIVSSQFGSCLELDLLTGVLLSSFYWQEDIVHQGCMDTFS